MNKYDSEKINELANGIDLLELILQYQEPYHKDGRLWVFHCNNNPDTTGSLVVNPEQNYYKCYSCGSGSNALSYLIKERHMNFYQAARKICEYTGAKDIDVAEPSETMKFLRKLKRKAEKPVKRCDRVYQNYDDYDKLSKAPAQLWIDEGISAEIQRLYDVRTQPEYNRILYPIYDCDGRYICPKARSTLPKEMLDKLGLPKYKYLGSPGYCDYLVGERVANEEINKKSEIIIFEGIKSCMLAYQYGFKNTVAAETSVLNKAQVNLILKMRVKNVVIAFDHDKSKSDMIKNTEILRRFANVYVVVDKYNLLMPKDSPVDRGADVWNKLYNLKEKVQ
jgi:DNA primase